ncbi:uncharacterized protein NECHADRAFT_77412 [Fusarium vanettenii 77-13-4]|uniref:Uncharacterized protein n=1 Tax=Fusarium vanettenii (strain ATCC MYA-4622 / CBS 123669 / FGSC 9596 / NRRL 45880 / 77-13-4) TaxID=660122 RepID=C7YL57_FUSV7|nr:uncharacterized protein NECHADRAFT_77412 [Fusarium vanettenii 77-13-4]EEU46731.1 hypothetical protein NECHADRAFT_77412 [Fusarium vanettenii 77-13-4]
MALYEYEKYLIARGALLVVTAWIPASILFFCALCLTRRRKDPARTAFTYLKLALPVFAGYAFFDICSVALTIAVVRERDDYYYGSYDAIRAIQITSSSTAIISNFFDKIVDILVMIMLLRISTGIVIAQSGHAGPIGKILRLGSYAFSTLLAILTIAALGLNIRFLATFYGDSIYVSDSEAPGEDAYNKARQIDFAFRVLVFVAALGIVARSVMVKMQPKAEKTLSWCSTMLIAMSIAWLLRTTYCMASIAAWSDFSNSRNDRYEYYYNILDVVFAVWPQFTVLCMIFALGTAKAKGLWSTPQPFNAPQGNQQTAWGYSYNNGPQPTAPPMVQQQPQFQQPQQQYQQPQQHQYQQQYQQPQPVSPVQQGWQPQQPQQTYSAYTPSSPSQTTRSPPPHEETMGFNHQADGTPPSVSPHPYGTKAGM